MAFPPASFFTGQLVTAAMLNANLRDNLNTLNGGGLVPTGLIGVWAGAISIIPSGWGLCDGGAGRIDLRDVFPICAGNLYAVGATGGATTATPGAHTGHAVGQPAHAGHTVGGNTHASVTDNPSGAGDTVAVGPGHSGQALSGAHSHANAALDSAGTVHGHGAGISLLPPYRAQAYMQKATSGLSFTTPRTWTAGDVPTAAQLNADIRDNINFLVAQILPVGSILMWGSAGTVPSGWQICDGTNGTPDLRSKFVLGAGNTYAVGATGGALTQRLPAHTSHTPTQADDHGTHTATQAGSHATVTAAIFGTPGNGSAILPSRGDSNTHSGFGVDAHPAHTNFSVNGHSAHDDLSVLPPFYSLVYMQLMSLPAFTTPRTWTNGETVQAAEFNTYIRDNENYINAASVPLLGCAWWSGSLASIPANYIGAPALYDQFIAGAGNGSDGFYVPSQQGGASSVTPAAHPTHTVTQPSSHGSHVVTQAADHIGNNGWQTGGGSSVTAIETGVVPVHYAHSFTVDAPVHAHAFDVDAGAAHSAHAAITTLPPYKALAFIERFT